MLMVDKIITISLRENVSRRKLTTKELAKLNLTTEFYLAERDRENGDRGCFDSHIQVCRQALANNCNHVLIFEDDVKILPFKQKQIDAINNFLTKHSDQFDILYLGLIVSKMWFCGYSNIVRAKGVGGHAYILTRRAIEELSKQEFTGKPIDKIFKNEFKCYSVYPIIAEQYSEEIVPSDLTPFRVEMKARGIKDQAFWDRNYQKQKWLPWKNLHKTFCELFAKKASRRVES